MDSKKNKTLYIIVGDEHSKEKPLNVLNKMVNFTHKKLKDRKVKIGVGMETSPIVMAKIVQGDKKIKGRPIRETKDFSEDDQFKSEREMYQNFNEKGINIRGIDNFRDTRNTSLMSAEELASGREKNMALNGREMALGNDIVFLFVGATHIFNIAQELQTTDKEAKIFYVMYTNCLQEELFKYTEKLKQVNDRLATLSSKKPDNMEDTLNSVVDSILQQRLRVVLPRMEQTVNLMQNKANKGNSDQMLESFAQILTDLYIAKEDLPHITSNRNIEQKQRKNINKDSTFKHQSKR